MSFLYPILSTRSSDLLVQRRLLTQLQSDQLELLKIQTQISTGRKLLLPSDSPLSAARGINVQRILEEKQQARTNIDTSRSFLAATDNALSTVSKLINEAKSVAIGASQSTISDSQRATYAQQIQQSIVQLLNAGNYSFRGRHLFAGSQTSANPFDQVGDFIAFSGDDTSLRSYLDDELLLASNLTSSEVFGAISSDVRGNRDMNPILTRGTRLDDLRGGLGITLGAIQISDGTRSQVVDLSNAKTIDDVLRLIERNPPSGRKLTARITDYGLSIDIDDAGGGNDTVHTGSGSDTVHGGTGDDFIDAGGGSNVVDGGDDRRGELAGRRVELCRSGPELVGANGGVIELREGVGPLLDEVVEVLERQRGGKHEVEVEGFELAFDGLGVGALRVAGQHVEGKEGRAKEG